MIAMTKLGEAGRGWKSEKNGNERGIEKKLSKPAEN